MADQNISLCQYTPWVEYEREDLPFKSELKDFNGNWRYTLPIKYLVSKQKLVRTTLADTTPITIDKELYSKNGELVSVNLPYLYNNAIINDLSITDAIKGKLENDNHYIILSDGSIWFDGGFPYSELVTTLNWTDSETGGRFISTFKTVAILSRDFNFRKKDTNGVHIVEDDTSILKEDGTRWQWSLNTIAPIYNQKPNDLRANNPLGLWTNEGVIYTIIRNGVTTTDDTWKIYIEVQPDNAYYPVGSGFPKFRFADSNNNLITQDDVLALIPNLFNKDKILSSFLTTNAYNISLDLLDSIKKANNLKDISYTLNKIRDYVKLPDDDDAQIFSPTRMLVNIQRRVPIPYRSCYDGLEATYTTTETYKVYYKKVCIGDASIRNPNFVGSQTVNETLLPGITADMQEDGVSYTTFYSSSIETVVKTIIEYDDQKLNRDLQGCSCIDIKYVQPAVAKEFAECGCRLVEYEETYRICPDQVKAEVFSQYKKGRQTPLELYELLAVPTQLNGNTVSLTNSDLLKPLSSFLVSSYPCKFPPSLHKTVVRFDANDIIKNTLLRTVNGLFNGVDELNCYITGSTSSGSYFYDIEDCDSCTQVPYFSVVYGNKNGSGSLHDEFSQKNTPTRSTYSQYRLLCTEDYSNEFTYYNNTTSSVSDDIYLINFRNKWFGDKLDVGNFQINLAELSGSFFANKYHTGSNVKVNNQGKILQLIDNSLDGTDQVSLDSPNVFSYDIVSGSLENGIYNNGTGSIDTNPQFTTYGKVFPQLGIIQLDANMLNSYLNFNTVTGSNIEGDNAFKIHTAISGAAVLGYPMKARNVVYKNTSHYFVKVPVYVSNFSNNPTFSRPKVVTLKTGGTTFIEGVNFENIKVLKYPCFIQDPVVYITTIGLYDDIGNLLAIAKLSRPVKKTLHNEVNVHIRLSI